MAAWMAPEPEEQRTAASADCGVRSWLDIPEVRPTPRPDTVPEAMGAGFIRDTDGRYGPVRGRVGFEAGGHADVLEPCSVLAELTGQALGRMGELSDDELVGVMRAARRVASWQAAVELEAVHELVARRMDEQARSGPTPGERAAAELAVALTLTCYSAGALMDLAGAAHRIPSIGGGLARGEIDVAKALVFRSELAWLDPMVAERLAAAAMLDAPGLTTAQLRARLHRAVLAADPDAVRRRQASGRADTRVEAWHEPSGNAALAGRELPPAAALAADAHLTALARAMIAAGAPGTLEQVRVDVYLALLSGRDPDTLLSVPRAAPSASAGSATVTGTATDPTATDRTATDRTATDRTATDRTATDDTGTDDIAAGATAAGATAPESSAPESSAPESSASERSARGDSPPAAPTWPCGPLGTIHLTMPLSAWAGLTDNPGEVAGRGPVDADACRELTGVLSGQPGVAYCLTVTTEAGQPVGHACAGTPPARDRLTAWLGGLTVRWLDVGGACDHALETASYRPGSRLAHLVRVLNPACTAPGCRRPAHRSDLDHVLAYAKGGRTCWCNIHPGCRRHHQLKQQPGWHVEMFRPGVLSWTLPHGRAYTTIAEPYPV